MCDVHVIATVLVLGFQHPIVIHFLQVISGFLEYLAMLTIAQWLPVHHPSPNKKLEQTNRITIDPTTRLLILKNADRMTYCSLNSLIHFCKEYKIEDLTQTSFLRCQVTP